MTTEYFAVLTVQYTDSSGMVCVRGDNDVFMPGVGADKDIHTAQDVKDFLFALLKRQYKFQHAEIVHWSIVENKLKEPPAELTRAAAHGQL